MTIATPIRKCFLLLASAVTMLLTSTCATVEPIVVTRVIYQTVETTPQIVQVTATPMPTLPPTETPTATSTPTPTPIPWQSYRMTETIRIGNIGKLWMPVPREWDGIGMSNVEVVSISPPPDDLYEDVQGNLIAFWDAGYRGSTDYSIAFNIDLAPVNYDIDPDSIGEYDTSSWEYQRYTQPSEWIQSSDEAIVELAHQIAGDETNPYIQARLVHRWVATNIRAGDVADALTTLETRAAGCGGHSWLFAALLRALGIPARGVGGLCQGSRGYFTSGDTRSGTLGGHIWSEFYLPGYGWIQCDTSGGLRNFAEINEPRIVMFRGEDIELGHGYPLGTVPWFTIPNRDVLDASTPPTQTHGENLTLAVEYLGSLAQ